MKMTFEQLNIFVAVAEREHLTRAAEYLRLTPSAVSASIKNLEAFYNVQLFHRVGRRIELTDTGRIFLGEAKAVLSRAQSAALILSELGQIKRGTLNIQASQTIATYWLPPRLMRFHAEYPGVEIGLNVGNTKAAVEAVLEGTADIGFIEGSIDQPELVIRRIAHDELVIVAAPSHPLADGRPVTVEQLVGDASWILREAGSGTRSEFEAALEAEGGDASALNIALVLPSNEAVLSAVRGSMALSAVSRLAALPLLQLGQLKAVAFPLPARGFRSIRHKERHFSEASKALIKVCMLQV
jgi:DNA-binding transcriptional LysR family regulator